ncbi:MAG: hypothetical protein ACTSP4_00905 [Candidatus Hodarchaeales archaeon]
MRDILEKRFQLSIKQLVSYILIIFAFGGAVAYRVSDVSGLEKRIDTNHSRIEINQVMVQNIKEDMNVKLASIQSDLVWVKEYLKEDSKYKYNKHKYNKR